MNDNYTIVNGELYHYGVPGMRWGHKRGSKKTENSDKATKSKTSKGKKIAAGVLAGIGAVGVAAVAVKVNKERKAAVLRTIQKMALNTKPKRAAHLPRHREAWNILQKEMANARRMGEWPKRK